MTIHEPSFLVPRSRKVMLKYPVIVKGKDCPRDGLEVASAGYIITIFTENGHEWYGLFWNRKTKTSMRVAVLPIYWQ